MTEFTDDDLNALLPDYLNKNLKPQEHNAVAAYLKRSDNAAAALENWKFIFSEIDRVAELEVRPDPPGLEQFLTYARQHPLYRRTTARSWLHHLLSTPGGWLKPAFSVAMAVLVIQSAILLRVAQFGINNSVEEATRGVGPREPARMDLLTVAFKPGTTEQQLRNLLLSMHGQFRAGPSGDLGDYQLAVPVGAGPYAINVLRSSGLTLSAEFSGPGEPASKP